MALAEPIEKQIAELARAYNPPLRATFELLDGNFSPFTKRDRLGEVCMVVRRPSGRLLTARKSYYPPDTYRLLTGGITHGEPIETALLREVYEETGLDVVVRHFLAVIQYDIRLSESAWAAHSHASASASTMPEAPGFATFAFLLDETGGMLMSHDPDEQIAAFREVWPDELMTLADHLKAVPDTYDPEIAGTWQAWGHFRAVVHRVVSIALSKLAHQQQAANTQS